MTKTSIYYFQVSDYNVWSQEQLIRDNQRLFN